MANAADAAAGGAINVAIPTVAEIAKLYTAAFNANNTELKAHTDLAIKRLALAESSAAEAATLVAFVNRVG